jgi:hypothetical protein
MSLGLEKHNKWSGGLGASYYLPWPVRTAILFLLKYVDPVNESAFTPDN